MLLCFKKTSNVHGKREHPHSCLTVKRPGPTFLVIICGETKTKIGGWDFVSLPSNMPNLIYPLLHLAGPAWNFQSGGAIGNANFGSDHLE